MTDQSSLRAAQAREGRCTLFAIFVLTLVSMADRQVVSILAGPMKAELRLGDFQLSLVLGVAFAVCYTVSAYPFGWLADRWSRGRTIFFAVLLWSLAAAGSGLVGTFVLLLIMRGLVGAGEAAFAPAAHALLANRFRRERLGLVIAVQSVGVPLGAALGVIGAGFVLSGVTSTTFAHIPFLAGKSPWQIAFVVVALPGLILAPLALTLREPPPPKTAEHPALEPILPFLQANAQSLACFCLGIGMAGIALSNLTIWTPEYLRRSFGTDPAGIGAKFGAIGFAAALIGQLATGVLLDRLTGSGVRHAPMRLYRWFLLALAPVAAVAYSAPSANWFFVALFVMLLLLTPALSLGPVGIQLLSPEPLRARLGAGYTIVLSLMSFAIGPLVAGALSQYVVGEARLGLALASSTVASAIAGFLLLNRAMAASLSPTFSTSDLVESSRSAIP